ncbi:MAG: hypothetical protein NUV46_03090 [Nanoarchaeota archaeon]|nr:hypothetical protein [Nanoarchaeota archaeon]
MVWEITLVMVLVHIVAAWLILKIESIPKLFAFIAIGILLFLSISFAVSISAKHVDFRTPRGWIEAGGMYTTWLSGTFNRAKSITLNIVKLDWFEKNEESEKIDEKTNNESIWDKLK